MKLLVQILLLVLWVGFLVVTPDPYRLMVIGALAGWQVGVWIGRISERIV